MATTMRSVDTRFWVDGWVRKLNALDRYTFLYFLTNTHSSWCGVYELDISMVAFETGLEERELLHSILPRLSPKIIYIDGWVYIQNFEKYHNSKSEQTKKGIENAWKVVPEHIRLKIREITTKADPLEGVSPFASASASAFASASASASAPTERALEVPKITYGEFNNVHLTEGEYSKLCDALSEPVVQSLIAELGSYMASTGKRYRSHYATLQSWARRKMQEYAQKQRPTTNQIAEI